MPNYKTHSIHGDLIFPYMNKRIFINKEDFKTYCFGFDTLIVSDYDLFNKQHEEKTKLYFETLLKKIKKHKLQDNSEVMAFLYGQIDHLILDISIHPLIYYMSEGLPKEHLLSNHALIETKIDDYIKDKYQDDFEYTKWKINDQDLKKLINSVYKLVYKKSIMMFKYDLGIKSINIYDKLARRNAIKITPIICSLLNTGDITYNQNYDEIMPYLNLKNYVWQDPETGDLLNDSFDDLWSKSMSDSLEAIDDVNKYLYDNKKLNTSFIKEDISANTGLPCKIKQKLTYIKKY